jgi:hypothetical protein
MLGLTNSFPTPKKQVSAMTTRLEQLIAKRQEFAERLATGETMIEQARLQGKDTTAWEDHWMNLFRMYERVCERVSELLNKPPQSQSPTANNQEPEQQTKQEAI